MVFLPGDHILDMNITVANVVRLTMRGESSSSNIPTVVCSRLVGFSFTSMMELKIYSLAFTSCCRRHAITLPPDRPDILPLDIVYVAMYLQSTQYAELSNSSFHHNNATSLAMNNTSITQSGNTDFVHNRACADLKAGGAIIVLDSNLTVTGNATFLDNSVFPFEGGGAIFTSGNTVLSFNGTNDFINNSAGTDGGAICTSGNTVLSFNGASNFINNSAGLLNGGGAIYASDNTILNFFATNSFINNSAYTGGAIATNNIQHLA